MRPAYDYVVCGHVQLLSLCLHIVTFKLPMPGSSRCSLVDNTMVK